MDEDAVVDSLREITSLLRKKMRRIAADIIDGHNDLYHGSAMFRKDPESQKEKIIDALSRAEETISKIKRSLNEIDSELESVSESLRNEMDRIFGMIDEEERILEEVSKDNKKIPRIMDDFYHLNNMIYNMILTIRNDYQLRKGSVYSRKK